MKGRINSTWMMYLVACVSVLFLPFILAQDNENPLLIKTHSGWIQGKLDTSATGKPVQAFLGIPYAEPPIGNLRFKHPVQVKDWTDVLNATSFPDSCMQRLLRISYHVPILRKLVSITPLSEDCLKLNIWVPSPRPTKAPVVIFIYGGGYSFGSSVAPTNLGDVMASEGQVIVVTLNYRVASFGFLFLDHNDSPGNAGLYDQRLAIEWIYKNIHAFGGDPENMTLFGQSAGSSSVMYHLLSGKIDHAFIRIILCSPPRLSFVTVDRQFMKDKGMQLAQNVGCTSENVSQAIECMREVGAEDLIANEPGVGYNSVVFYPVTDGDIVPNDPRKIVEEKKFKPVDVLIGSNKNEGTIFLMINSPHVYQPIRDEAKPVRQDFIDMLLESMFLKSSILQSSVELQYLQRADENDSERIREASDQSINDVLFACPTKRYANLLSKSEKNVFSYYYVHPPPRSFVPKWLGVFHGSDLLYTFGDIFTTKPELPKAELDFALRMMRYWTNFVRSGDPNQRPDGNLENITWPEYTTENHQSLILSPNSTAVIGSSRAKKCAFWNKFMPLLSYEVGVPDHIIERSFGF